MTLGPNLCADPDRWSEQRQRQLEADSLWSSPWKLWELAGCHAVRDPDAVEVHRSLDRGDLNQVGVQDIRPGHLAVEPAGSLCTHGDDNSPPGCDDNLPARLGRLPLHGLGLPAF